MSFGNVEIAGNNLRQVCCCHPYYNLKQARQQQSELQAM